MYFVVLVAFALVLTDGLPPRGWDLIGLGLTWLNLPGWNATATLIVILVQIVLIFAIAALRSRLALAAGDGTEHGDALLEDRCARTGQILTAALLVAILLSMLGTNWLNLVRFRWRLAELPLLADWVAIGPFLLAAVFGWIAMFPAERALRSIAAAYYPPHMTPPRPWSLGAYLSYKARHQILTVFVPMSLICLVKFYVDRHREALVGTARIAWIPDAIIGLSAAFVLLISPVLLRFLWETRPLPSGPLRDRLERLCDRIGLRYREILIWESQSLIVNAAVMGLVPSVRYILLSDGLIQALSPRQVEAVFGHEAGHVRRRHLHYFGVFALLSMLIVGGLLEILVRVTRWEQSTLQMTSLAALLGIWSLAFGYVSRRFERQADLYGAQCLASDSEEIEPEPRVAFALDAPAIADAANPAAAVAAAVAATPDRPADRFVQSARLFGRTLLDVAHFNGIPIEAPSWRHGSVQSRAELLMKFARDPAAAAAFERRVAWLKGAMLVLTAFGCLVAAAMYGPDVLRLWRR